jgi:serine/threonine protein kinase
MALTVGQEILCSGKSFTIIEKKGDGAEGDVWGVRDQNKKEFALKILKTRSATRKERKKKNINNLFKRAPLLIPSLKTQEFNVALPLHIYENGDDFGYIMELCPGKEINEMMMEGKFDDMPTCDRIEIIKKIAKSAAWFSSNALCYQDFSHKNFMYDEKTKKVSVIDCDNVAPNLHNDNSTVGGTGFYAAPEVAFKICQPSIESDQYALAVLFYKIMVGPASSPYHGKEFYKKAAGNPPQDMFQAALYSEDESWGTKWLTFVFDDKDPCNRIDPLQFKKEDYRKRQNTVVKNWKNVPDTMKEYFRRSFKNPLDSDCRKNRVKASAWMELKILPTSSGVKADNKKKTTQSKESTQKGAIFVLSQETSETKAGKRIETRISVGDSCVICPATTKNGVASKLGEVAKKGKIYTFTSQSIFLLKIGKDGVLGDLKKGQSLVLSGGEEIFLSIRPNEKLIITLT